MVSKHFSDAGTDTFNTCDLARVVYQTLINAHPNGYTCMFRELRCKGYTLCLQINLLSLIV